MNGVNTPINNLIGLISRRRFLKTAFWSTGTLILSGFGLSRVLGNPKRRQFPGRIVGASSDIGHLARGGDLPQPKDIVSVDTVIIGGGIAGLSAAHKLKKNGYKDFVLLEMESHVGGNSSFGKNEITSYPWGAHYLPLPGPEAKSVRDLLEELGVITGYDSAGLPIYNEYFLCADPHERLFIQGRWQEGVVPQVGITQKDRRQYEQFFKQMEKMKVARGNDGKRAFMIPVDQSSQDPKFLNLDKISMASYLQTNGWDSPHLSWYVNYACRDDYGLPHDKVSAWAGIHYFASRVGRGSNADSHTVLTWPEGNGWLVEQLRARVSEKVQDNSFVYSIENQDGQVLVDYLDTKTKGATRLKAKSVIFAGPRFVAARVLKDFKTKKPAYLESLQYWPWVVANVSLRSLPRGNGAPLSWDNVSYYSESLGYVVATHQSLSLNPKKTVITYYLPLTKALPSEGRKEALMKKHQDWAQEIAQDLSKMHPGIENEIENIDVCVWGHGMIAPTVGFVWGNHRSQMLSSVGNVYFAHSDMSGISIFEEAHYRGVSAAEKVLSNLSHAGRLS